MRPSSGLFVTVAVIASLAASAWSDEPKQRESKPFRDRIVLIGTGTTAAPSIWTMAPDGTDLRRVLRLKEVSIADGRVAPDGKRLAYSILRPPDGKVPELWLLEANGQTQKIAERGAVTAWSPDGRQVAFYRPRSPGKKDADAWESYVIDVRTKTETKHAADGRLHH
jgi:Tol biopolymer transport system component